MSGSIAATMPTAGKYLCRNDMSVCVIAFDPWCVWGGGGLPRPGDIPGSSATGLGRPARMYHGAPCWYIRMHAGTGKALIRGLCD
jgi:hypothetical protein